MSRMNGDRSSFFGSLSMGSCRWMNIYGIICGRSWNACNNFWASMLVDERMTEAAEGSRTNMCKQVEKWSIRRFEITYFILVNCFRAGLLIWRWLCFNAIAAEKSGVLAVRSGVRTFSRWEEGAEVEKLTRFQSIIVMRSVKCTRFNRKVRGIDRNP